MTTSRQTTARVIAAGIAVLATGYVVAQHQDLAAQQPDYRAGHAVTAPAHRIGTAAQASAPVTLPSFAEDDPRWNCRTMGNHICGTDKNVTVRMPDGTITTTDARDAAWLIANGATFVEATR